MIQDRLVKENGCKVLCENLPGEINLELRKGCITGTDLAKITGVSPWGNPISVFLDKTLPPEEHPKEPDNWFKLKCGLAMEPLIAEWYAKATGYKVEPVTYMLQHPEIPFIAGDLDYIAETPAGEMIGLEFKTTDEMFVNEKWAPGILGEGGKLPKYYEMQVRLYMAVTGLDRFMVLCCYGFDAAKVIPVSITRDIGLEEELLSEAVAFWNTHVVTGVQPEGGMLKDDLKAVQRSKFRPDEKETGTLPEEARAFLEEYDRLQALKKESKAETEKIDQDINTILAEICRLSEGRALSVLPAGEGMQYEVTNKVTSRTTVDAEKLKLCYPSVFDECKKVSSSEATAIKQKKIPKKKGE